MTKFSDYETDYTTCTYVQSPYEEFTEMMDMITQLKTLAAMKRRTAEHCQNNETKRNLENHAAHLEKNRLAIIRRLERDYCDCGRNVENRLNDRCLMLINPMTGKAFYGAPILDRRGLYIFLCLEKTLYGKGYIHPIDLRELGDVCGKGAFPYQAFAEILADLENQK